MSTNDKVQLQAINKTRWSLVTKLKDLSDQDTWQEFFDLYWRLIYSVALKAGHSNEDAEEVVQETVIEVTKQIGKFRSDPEYGSFKGWLLRHTRWKILDQFKKTNRHQRIANKGSEAEVANLADESEVFEDLWDQEWAANISDICLERLRKRVKPKHFQIFQMLVCEGKSGKEVSKILNISATQAYVVKYRLTRMLNIEMKELERLRI